MVSHSPCVGRPRSFGPGGGFRAYEKLPSCIRGFHKLAIKISLLTAVCTNFGTCTRVTKLAKSSIGVAGKEARTRTCQRVLRGE